MVYYLILLVYLDSRDSISSVLKFSVGVSQNKLLAILVSEKTSG